MSAVWLVVACGVPLAGAALWASWPSTAAGGPPPPPRGGAAPAAGAGALPADAGPRGRGVWSLGGKME